MKRQIILDTETTGLDHKQGHRIIEIGCVELINRKLTGNHYHVYINPERKVDAGALSVHGITDDFLKEKPLFTEIAESFCDFIKNTELIAHNASFDVDFLNAEFNLIGKKIGQIADYCEVIDTLKMARKMHPGQRNSLDALCKRYHIDNSNRDLHGALLDAEILAQVYLAMTSGQLELFAETDEDINENTKTKKQKRKKNPLPIILATEEELRAHNEFLNLLAQSSDNNCLWTNTEENKYDNKTS